MEGRVLRRSVTLADQLAAVGPAAPAPGSCNLRDLLKLRDEDDGRRAAAAVTLASAMQADRRASSPPASSPSAVAAAAAARTLLDIIRDDQPNPAPASYGAGDPFVRRAVSLPAPQTASPPASTRAVTPPLPPPEASPPTDQDPEEEEQGERVSLMALLEQTDRHWSAVATVPSEQDPAAAASEQDAFGPEDDADLPDPEPGRCAGAAGGGCCCVCMARAKGAAFIPCGHTFCRGCARELLAGRGRCPLCNAAIVDVLDIF